MSWLSDWWGGWFTSDRKKYFISLILKAINLFFTRVSSDVWTLVQDEVRLAEESGKDGVGKAKLVLERVYTRLGDEEIPEYILRLLIESAVTVMKTG